VKPQSGVTPLCAWSARAAHPRRRGPAGWSPSRWPRGWPLAGQRAGDRHRGARRPDPDRP